MDLSSLPEEMRTKAANYQKPKTDTERWSDGWGSVDDPLKGKRQADIDLDPSIYEELARRDPEFKRKLDDSKIEEITIQFAKANPDYVPTEANYNKVIRYIRKNQLKDPGVPLHDVLSTAYLAGFWTVRNLTAVFKTLMLQGAMDVREGKSRPLSKAEQLAVIADVRAGDLLAATENYLLHSYNGNLPRGYTSVRAFLAAHPALASDASWFIWSTFHAGEFSVEEITEFKKHMRTVQLPTFQTLEQAFPKWQANRTAVALERPAEPEPAPRDPNSLSAAELDEAIAAARKGYRQNQG